MQISQENSPVVGFIAVAAEKRSKHGRSSLSRPLAGSHSRVMRFHVHGIHAPCIFGAEQAGSSLFRRW